MKRTSLIKLVAAALSVSTLTRPVRLSAAQSNASALYIDFRPVKKGRAYASGGVPPGTSGITGPTVYSGGLTAEQTRDGLKQYMADCGIKGSAVLQMAVNGPKLLAAGAIATACVVNPAFLEGADWFGLTSDKAKPYLARLHGIAKAREQKKLPPPALGGYLYIAQHNTVAGTKDWDPTDEPLGNPVKSPAKEPDKSS
jgi:hypothetical protein